MSGEETKHFSMAGNNFEKSRYFLPLFLMASTLSLRINKLRYRKIPLMIQKRNHGLTEVSRNFCH